MTIYNGMEIPDFDFKPGMVIVYRGCRETENVLEVLEVRHRFDTPGPSTTEVRYRLTFGHDGFVMEGWEWAGDLILEFSDRPDVLTSDPDKILLPENLGKIIRIEEAE